MNASPFPLAAKPHFRPHFRPRTPSTAARRLVSGLVLACLAPTAAAAEFQADRIYAGIDFGVVDYTGSATELQDELRERGHSVDLSLDEDGMGLLAYVGYEFTSQIAVELGWANLGGINSDVSGSTSDLDALGNDLRELQPVSGQGPTLALRLSTQPIRTFSPLRVDARLGAFHRIGDDGDIRINGRTVGHADYERTTPFLSTGLRVELSGRLSFYCPRLSVFFLDGDDPSVLYSTGLLYAF